MKWWEIAPSCIFALDADSIVTKSDVYFTNNANRSLKSYTGVNRIETSSTAGLRYNKLSYEENIKIYTYKSLKLNDTHLIFDTPVLLPNEFTFILKCKVNVSSLLLSNNGSNYGLTFGTGEMNSSDDSRWRISGYNTGQDFLKNDLDRFNKGGIQTVILKGNIATKSVVFITDYGSYLIPSDSPAFQSFLQSRTYTTIGYSHTGAAWRPNLDIIAYGLFDKIFTGTEISQVLESIDSQFLLKTSDLKPTTGSGTTLNNHSNPGRFVLTNIPLNVGSILKTSKPIATKFKTVFNIISPEIGVQSLLYKDMKTISDVILEEGQPVIAKLFLYERGTGTLLKTTISDVKGRFNFYNLSRNFEYRVTSNDPKYQFRTITKTYEENKYDAT